MNSQAIEQLQKTIEFDPSFPGAHLTLSMAYLKYVPPIAFSDIYVALGDREKAFVWLEKAYEDRSGGLTDLARVRFSSQLRSDARFQDLMRRLGLPQ